MAGTQYNVFMRIITRSKLLEYCKRYPNARQSLLTWYADVNDSTWTKPLDIKDTYGNRVSFIGGKRVVFKIKGNQYRLVVQVEYQFQTVYIRWCGTHAEYDKIDTEAV